MLVLYIRLEMTAHDEQREIVIRKSRELTKLRYFTTLSNAIQTLSSKQAIYCFHDGEIEKGKSILADANLKIEASLPLATAELRGGSFSAAMEEYVGTHHLVYYFLIKPLEAYCFMQYLTDETLIESTQVPLAHWSEYIGGVLDFTGELVRYGIKMATERDIPKVQQCASMVKAIERQVLFNLILKSKLDGSSVCLIS